MIKHYCQQCATRIFYHKELATCPHCSTPLKKLGDVIPLELLRPLPYADWPPWAKSVKQLFAKPEDKGVGATIKRIAAKFGGEWFKWIAKSLKMPCACENREAQYDLLYPYTEVLS